MCGNMVCDDDDDAVSLSIDVQTNRGSRCTDPAEDLINAAHIYIYNYPQRCLCMDAGNTKDNTMVMMTTSAMMMMKEINNIYPGLAWLF